MVDFGESDAHHVGQLLARSKTSDVVDAAVILLAATRRADVVTGDVHDLSKLVVAAGTRPRLHEI